MVGVVVFRCEHRGRAIDLEFGVLKGGDTGAACAIIGNYALRKDKYDGLVDVGAGKAVLRNVDQRGDLVIPITSEPARLSAMLALGTEQDPEGEEDEGEGEPRGPELGELSGHVRLRDEFVTLLPGECKFVQVAVEDHHGAALRETSFVASEELDEMVAGVKLAERRALLETDADGFSVL